MRRDIFGRHLYNQIVAPLVVAALAVGVIATVVAVYFLSDLTESWVDEVAQGASANLLHRIDTRSNAMQSVAKLAAEDRRLRDALQAEEFTTVRGILTQSNVALGFDNLMLLDSAGTVVATTGLAGIAPGDVILAQADRTWADLAMPHPAFLEIGGTLTLTAMQPVLGRGESVYTLCLSEAIDERFLLDLATGAGDAFCFYDEDLTPIAYTVPRGGGEGERTGSDPEPLLAAVSSPAEEIQRALEQAVETGEGSSVVAVAGTQYRATARRIDLPNDPEDDTRAYLVSLISQQVSDDARITTTNLITMWSIVAVVALIGLGGWVARRVSEPLVALTEGAQRIADGDFSTKIPLHGKNEIAELAESFNQMTDSLKDRSENLTKKVLELATLYEMSRALGGTLDLGELLQSVLDSALRIFGADLGYVTMRDHDAGTLEIRARSGGVPARVDDQALRNSMSEWVIREARPLIFNPSADRSTGQVEVVTGAMAALCVPLISAEGTIGAITVGSQDPEFRFTSDDVRLLSTIANHVTIAIGNIDLFSSLQEAYLATVRSLAAAVDAKDPYTRGHSEGVAVYATMIAERMGLSHDQRIALEMAAYLHDIGKIGIKESILLKPGQLTDDEMSQMRHHPLIGANILKPVGFPWPITPVVRHHHERWDGEGYPAGLKGEEIPLLARILTVADAYEAMIADRPYRKGRTMEEGAAELRRCAGTQFDAAVVDAFVEALEEQREAGQQGVTGHEEEVGADEARAIFVALTEGMLVSFRRLGGPRLAANAESALNGEFSRAGLPLTVSAGRVALAAHGPEHDGADLEQMRRALRLLDETLGSLSGHSLVDHFYADAMESLSERMRRLTVHLEFYPG